MRRWTAEDNCRILLGILAQLKNSNIKLDMENIATFVGPNITAGALACHISRLKKQAEEDIAASDDRTPTSTPQKRKAGPCTPAKKRQKINPNNEGDNMDAASADMPRPLIDLVKEEIARIKGEEEVVDPGTKEEGEGTKQGIKAESDDDDDHFFAV